MPGPYGFVPRTLCAGAVAALAEERTGRRGLEGDDDPLDILVLTEKDFTHGNILMQALPIGGLGMLDRNEVDDKIVAVMVNDAVYGGVDDIGRLPDLLVDRLKHYFLTYKQAPTDSNPACELLRVYGCAEACEVIRRSQADYREALRSGARAASRKGLTWTRSSSPAEPASSARTSCATHSRTPTRAWWCSTSSPTRGTWRAWPTSRRNPRYAFVQADIADREAVRRPSPSTGPRPSSTSPPRPTSTARSTTRGRSCART